MERVKRLVLCCLSALTVLYINVAYADSRWNVEITPIVTQEAWQQHPHIYEDRIIWKDFRSGAWDVYLFDLSERVEVPLIIGDRNQDEPRIHGNIVAYQNDKLGPGGWDIYIYDIVNKISKPLTTHVGNAKINPDIDGGRVVWQDSRIRQWDLAVFDIASGSEIFLPLPPSYKEYPLIHGDKIVWQDYRNGNWDIFLYDLSTKIETQITNDRTNQTHPEIYGDKIVWTDERNGNSDIYLYDIATGKERQITFDSALQQSAGIYGDKIIWEDFRNGNWDIYMRDLSSETETQITSSPLSDEAPEIYGNRIVWQRYEGGDFNVYMAELSPALCESVLNPPIVREASVAIHPNTLELSSKGLWITGILGLLDVDEGSARITAINGILLEAPILAEWSNGTMVKFLRSEVAEFTANFLEQDVTFRVEWTSDSYPFAGSSNPIRIMLRGKR